VVTGDGRGVITEFPAEDLLVAGQRYCTVGGPLPTVREPQSPRTRPLPQARPTAG
jgi:hypothetical protein